MQKLLDFFKNNLKPTFSKKERGIFLLLSAALFFLFILFTLIVRSDALRSFDFDMTVRVQDDIPVRVDEFFSWLSVIGRFEFSIVMLLVVLFIKRKILGGISFFLFGFAHVIELVGKSILSQPGPPHMFLRTTDLSMQFPGLHIHTDASYPSGHSLRVVFLFVLLVLLFWKSKKIPALLKYFSTGFFFLYTFLMLLSRVSLGEHWTTDVIGGALLGLSFAFISLIFL